MAANYKNKIIAVILAAALLTTATACDNTATNLPDDVPNGDFEEISEDGKWVGWTREDAAFNVRGVVDSEKLNGVTMEKSGSYFFSGTDGGNPPMRGTLTSAPFKLGGTGVISFKMGGGKDPEKIYVEFFEEGNDTALAKVSNDDCDGVFITDHLITKTVDLSEHIGKSIYVKVTDNDDGNDYSYVNLDAFHTCATQEEVDAEKADHDRQIAEFGEKPFEEDETSETIENGGFETGDLTGWKTLEGTALSRAGVVPTSQYYWTDRSVYGEGEYYLDGSNNGAIAENLTGAIRSTKFTLGGDGYISFMIGAGHGDSYVALCDGNTDEELITVHNEYFSDPALALTLLRVYMDAGEHIGKVVYLKVVDNDDGSNGGFAFLNVDDFRVSLTADQVAELEVEQMNKVNAETYTSASYDDITSLKNYYTNYPYPVPLNSLAVTSYVSHQVVDCGTVDLTQYLSDAKASYGGEEVTNFSISKVIFNGNEITEGFDSFDMSAPGYYNVVYSAEHEGMTAEASFTVVAQADKNSVANGDFEAGNLAGWTVLSDKWSIVEGNATGVISAVDYWGEKLPYNQGGSFHLDGWNTGIEEPEGWSIQSSNFVLGGSGFISLRMGGNAAAARVYLADGTEIGYYKQNRFNDANFPSLTDGGSWADMGTYVMDLSEHIGEEMYIVLCDEVIDGGWAHAFFDEVVTYYETAPDYATTVDTVPDGATASPVDIPWQLAENLI